MHSFIKEFISNSANASFRQINREKLFERILIFNNLPNLKSKKKDKKNAKIPIFEEEVKSSKLEKVKQIDLLQKRHNCLPNSNKIFQIEKITNYRIFKTN